jgi:hypothetical protein
MPTDNRLEFHLPAPPVSGDTPLIPARMVNDLVSLDLMEPFRAIIAASVVLSAVNTGEVGPSDFVVAVTGTALTQAGHRRFC